MLWNPSIPTERGLGVHEDCFSLFLFASFMKAVHLGDILEIKAECLKLGRTLAFTSVDIVKKNDGAMVAQGRHTKHIGLTRSS